MILETGFLPGLPALIKNRAHFGVNPGLDRNQANWLELIALMNNGSNTTKSVEGGMKPAYNWQNKIILIAEDEDANFLYLKTAISVTKATVIRANNGREAVDLVKNKPEIDLVLMDIKMPVMNGVDATKVIKSFNSSMVVIAQTAYANEDDRTIYLNAGCNDFLAKPITRDKLLKTISQYL